MLAQHPDPLAPLPGGSDAAGRGMAPGSASLTHIPGHSWEMDLESTSCLPFPGGCWPGAPTSPLSKRSWLARSCQFQSAYFKQPPGMQGTCKRGWPWRPCSGPSHTAYEQHPEVLEAASRHTLPAKARQRLMGSLSSLPSCCSTL